MKRINKKAFTLAEVLISLAIMGIIFASLSAFISRYFMAGHEIYNEMEELSQSPMLMNFPYELNEKDEIWDAFEQYEIQKPYNVARDGLQNIYFSDTENHRIIQILKKNSSESIENIDDIEEIRVIAGTGVSGLSGNGGRADLARLHSPTALYFYRNSVKDFLYVLDSENFMIRRIDLSSNPKTLFYKTAYTKNTEEELSFSDEGATFLVDSLRNEIRMSNE